MLLKKPHHQLILKEKLRAFGLNPREWNLIPITECLYHIVSDSSSPLIFRGWTSPSQPLCWREISIWQI